MLCTLVYGTKKLTLLNVQIAEDDFVSVKNISRSNQATHTFKNCISKVAGYPTFIYVFTCDVTRIYKKQMKENEVMQSPTVIAVIHVKSDSSILMT